MTREEALNVLWWASKQHYPGDQMDITEYVIEAFDMAITALRGPVPDPETGLVNCGCGGKAETHELFGVYSGTYMTDCKECATGTTQYNTEKESQDAWNTAMGWKGGAE